jgi:hypothetical protein
MDVFSLKLQIYINGKIISYFKDLHRLEHLREVFADDNLITCCRGLLCIPGLVKLSLRRNKLKSVNFELCDM